MCSINEICRADASILVSSKSQLSTPAAFHCLHFKFNASFVLASENMKALAPRYILWRLKDFSFQCDALIRIKS